ncbi:unnamed protein product [Chrysoparadoxa australica]
MGSDPAADRRRKDEAVRATIMQKLHETGEKERLKDLLRERLTQSGWRDELKEHCKEIIRSKGLEKITVDELVAEITPKGRASVPDDVKVRRVEPAISRPCFLSRSPLALCPLLILLLCRQSSCKGFASSYRAPE